MKTVLVSLLLLTACGAELPGQDVDAGQVALDAGELDAGPADAGAPDAGYCGGLDEAATLCCLQTGVLDAGTCTCSRASSPTPEAYKCCTAGSIYDPLDDRCL